MQTTRPDAKVRVEEDKAQTKDLAELFGDAMTQEDLQEFLRTYAQSEDNMEVQGSLITITLSIAYSC